MLRLCQQPIKGLLQYWNTTISYLPIIHIAYLDTLTANRHCPAETHIHYTSRRIWEWGIIQLIINGINTMLQIDNYQSVLILTGTEPHPTSHQLKLWVTEKLPANDEQEIFRRQDWAHRFLLFPVASRHETSFHTTGCNVSLPQQGFSCYLATTLQRLNKKITYFLPFLCIRKISTKHLSS